MRIYVQAMSGGPLNAVHVTPKPLPALTTGSRDYIRKWAISHGMHCYAVGALPKAVLTAYEAAIER